MRSWSTLASLFIAASMTFADGAAAATVNLGPIKDNTLIQAPIGNSNGAGDGIYSGRVGALGDSTLRRALLAFDLSSIPAGSTVNSVTLRLEMAQSQNELDRLFTLHRVSADWGEEGSLGSGTGSPAETGDATWLFRFFSTQAWTTPGGDFTAAPSASQVVSAIGPYEWTGAGLVADVEFWLDNPASNFGWLLLGDESTSFTVRKFYSRQGLTPPVLTVDFTPTDIGVASGPHADRVWFAPPWPTPASGPVHLSYALPRAARVSLAIHDAAGRVVRHLVADAVETAGRHATVWDGRTDTGARAASGVYVASLVVDDEAHQRRIPLLR
jgi:hypothetical protein